jgi:hypothetical protein
MYRARTFKFLWTPGIDSKELIPPAYVAYTGRYDNLIPTRFLASIDCLKIPTMYSLPKFPLFFNSAFSEGSTWQGLFKTFRQVCTQEKKLSKAKGLVEILRVFFGELKLKGKSVKAGCQLRVTYIWLCVQQFDHLGHYL